MIQVEQLVKDYGSLRVLNQITFHIKQGEVVGLLGPNGAGKTTLMRIITGFIPASYGVSKVGGLDVFVHPKEVKKMIGYLPENCPLYPEMTVSEFLISMAQLNGVQSKDLKNRLDYVLEAVKINDKKKAIIGTLSKGYKQRVGLAQSLIHDPKVLILDEPTVGLDPTQIIEIRELIKNLKGDRTVILSTHILSEVSQICERMIIISNGTIAAEGTESKLINQYSSSHKLHIQVKEDSQKAVELIKEIEGITQAGITSPHSTNSYHQIEVEFQKDNDLRPRIAKKLIDNKFELLEMRGEQMTLEELFTRLTK